MFVMSFPEYINIFMAIYMVSRIFYLLMERNYTIILDSGYLSFHKF